MQTALSNPHIYISPCALLNYARLLDKFDGEPLLDKFDDTSRQVRPSAPPAPLPTPSQRIAPVSLSGPPPPPPTMANNASNCPVTRGPLPWATPAGHSRGAAQSCWAESCRATDHAYARLRRGASWPSPALGRPRTGRYEEGRGRAVDSGASAGPGPDFLLPLLGFLWFPWPLPLSSPPRTRVLFRCTCGPSSA